MRKLFGWAAIAVAAWGLSMLSGCNMTDGNSMEKDVDKDMPANTGFQLKTLKADDGHTRMYSVFIPHDYTADKKWPVIMFLHGMGEGGSDGVKCVTVGLGPEIQKRADTFEFIAVFPQSGSGDWDENGSAATDAMAALHQVEKDYSCDKQCVALTGLSHGGYGTWAIGAKYYTEFSALVPVCGEADHKDVQTLAKIPGIRAYHFTGDPFVSASESSSMVDEINSANGHADKEIIDGVGHAVWHEAYGSDDVFNWILTTRRPNTSGNAGDASHVKANEPG